MADRDVREYRLTFVGHPIGEFVAELTVTNELLGKTTEYRLLREHAPRIEVDLEEEDGYRVRCARVEFNRGDAWQRIRLAVPSSFSYVWNQSERFTPASIPLPKTWPE